jgi:hypothetical protein
MLDEIDFLLGVEADVADVHVVVGAVEAGAEGVAQAGGDHLAELGGGAGIGVDGRDSEVLVGVGGIGIGAIGDVDAEKLAVNLVEVLGFVDVAGGAGLRPAVAGGDVEIVSFSADSVVLESDPVDGVEGARVAVVLEDGALEHGRGR